MNSGLGLPALRPLYVNAVHVATPTEITDIQSETVGAATTSGGAVEPSDAAGEQSKEEESDSNDEEEIAILFEKQATLSEKQGSDYVVSTYTGAGLSYS